MTKTNSAATVFVLATGYLYPDFLVERQDDGWWVATYIYDGNYYVDFVEGRMKVVKSISLSGDKACAWGCDDMTLHLIQGVPRKP